MTTATILNY